MPTMNFPSLPTLGDEYLFNNTTYVYDGTKWVAKQSNEQNINQMIESHKVGVDQHNIAGIQGLADALSKTGDAVLDVKWLTKRSPMRTGYTAGDGQTLSRALYPDAIAAIQSGLVPTCADVEWLADPAKRGCFTLGDGSTTFRVPDYNGMQPGSYGPVYLGGGSAAGGAILRDRIQKITGRFLAQGGGYAQLYITADGAFYTTGDFTAPFLPPSGQATNVQKDVYFDSSRVVRSGDTTRPITAEGCLAIKLFGAAQNAGSADAAALATAVADLAARMSAVEGKVAVLEQRKFTTLTPSTFPSGAPHDTHETIDSVLPAAIVANSRYVLTNPFGPNVRVKCIAEIWYAGEWVVPGWDGNTGQPSPYSVGVSAHYVQGVGVRLTTGTGGIGAENPRLTGGANSIIGSSPIISAPCRVFVRKLEA